MPRATRFARGLGTALGLPLTVYPCGGASDSSLGGTSRQWSTARPSVPLQLVRDHGRANPLVILDEVDKLGEGRHNGNLGDLLHGLLERETARTYQDPMLEVPVDLSAVVWIATANDVERVPPTLRDRFRLVAMTEPGVEHAEVLIRSMSAELAEERGQGAAMAVDWSEGEVDIMADAWGGGSLRRLRSLVEKATDAVERAGGRVHH